MGQEDHWLHGVNFNVEEWDAKGQTYETLAICRTVALRALAVTSPARFRSRTCRPWPSTCRATRRAC
jgi:hypothetical protein